MISRDSAKADLKKRKLQTSAYCKPSLENRAPPLQIIKKIKGTNVFTRLSTPSLFELVKLIIATLNQNQLDNHGVA